jgi:class 3 adenylate cyclase
MEEKDIHATVLFVDIEDSTGIANHYTTNQYGNFLREFHDVVSKTINDNSWAKSCPQIGEIRNTEYHRFMGDEFIAFLPHDQFPDNPVEIALKFAARLKVQWYLSKSNMEDRLSIDKEPIELNIGINTGLVIPIIITDLKTYQSHR